MNDIKTTKKRKRPLLRMYLYNLREKAGLSINEITTALALSKPYYYQIEDGRKGHRMGVAFLNELAVALKVDFETVCQGELDYQKERRSLGLRHEQRLVLIHE